MDMQSYMCCVGLFYTFILLIRSCSQYETNVKGFYTFLIWYQDDAFAYKDKFFEVMLWRSRTRTHLEHGLERFLSIDAQLRKGESSTECELC